MQKIEKMPNANNNPLLKNYINYLKNELDKTKFLSQEENSELNYIFTYFSKGIEFNFNFDNIECVFYNNKNNKFSGKILLPPPLFNFKINNSSINLKLYEFDRDELENDLNRILNNNIKPSNDNKIKFNANKILSENKLKNKNENNINKIQKNKEIKQDKELKEKIKEKPEIKAQKEIKEENNTKI